LGLFSITVVLSGIQDGEKTKQNIMRIKGIGLDIKEFFSNSWNILRSSLIGVAIGILPGMGSGGSNLIAYAQAKQASKTKETFGKGNPEGIYASESSNNAAVGGALIPLLS